jgi:plastocyanin
MAGRVIRGGRACAPPAMKRLLPLTACAALAGMLALSIGGVTASGAAPAVKPRRAAIVDFAYTPVKLTITRGTRVSWTNKDITNHTVTFAVRGMHASTGNLAVGATKSLRFQRAGTFRYICDYHPGMHGTVVVK